MSIIPKTYNKQGDRPPYPHGHTYRTIHVALVQPPMLGDSTLLRAKGGSILGEKENIAINLPLLLMLFYVSLVNGKIIHLVSGWLLLLYWNNHLTLTPTTPFRVHLTGKERDKPNF